MAFVNTSFLNNTSSTIMRDPQHAARLFVDDQFRLAPKHKFLFHVAFNINPACLIDSDLIHRHRNEINMLVKSCDLPNISITTETLNQYNRKKNINITHKFNPLNMTFHDDNMGLINKMWQNYYNYYFADPSSAQDAGAYNRTSTKSSSYIQNTYGLDNNSSTPFFNYIIIYQMARHEFVSYKLHNPIITSWNHNKVDYSQAGTHDNQMTLAYEAVSYGQGKVTQGDPEGFSLEHYDQTPSPLTGVQLDNNTSPSFANKLSTSGILGETVSNIVTSVNTYQNSQELAPGAPYNNLSDLYGTATPGFNGLQGIHFPVAKKVTSTAVQASQINIIRR